MDAVASLFKNHQIEHWGWTPLQKPLSLEFYKTWIEKGYHGDMEYLKAHIPAKEDPHLLLPKARSAFVLTVDYALQENTLPTPHLKIASYAQGEDYHFWLKKKVDTLCLDLQTLFPNEYFLGFTDSSPVLERDLAYRAGLGWIGKNTCLLDRKRGSLFLIAEIYTTLPKETSIHSLVPDHCGTCDRCITACPTAAIEKDRTLNATQCISYWTIESKKIPPIALREKFAGWFFGCDICQTVCPWNIKIHDLAKQPDVTPSSSQELENELRLILKSSNKQLLKAFAQTPLTRAGGRGLKRNALIVIANLRLHNLKEEVLAMTSNKDLAELANWTLDYLCDQPTN